MWTYNGSFKKKSANGYGKQVFENGDIFEGIQNDDFLVEGIMTKAVGGAMFKQVYDVKKDLVKLKHLSEQKPTIEENLLI